MLQPTQEPAPPSKRFLVPPGRRAAGLLLALGLEALLFLALLTLGQRQPPRVPETVSVVRLTAPMSQQSRPAAEASEQEARQPEPSSAQEAAPAAAQPTEPAEAPPPPTPPPPQPEIRSPSLIPLSREQLAAADIAAIPSRRPAPSTAGRSKMGPPNIGSAGDTPRVEGSGPNGEPLYAASWYREPRDDELRGYLSTAQGPGWGLIACRTVADFRVDDCVGIDEYPSGSNMMRAVLAASWQFRVRPPRLGGRPQVGEWVRIRIDYDIKRL